MKKKSRFPKLPKVKLVLRLSPRVKKLIIGLVVLVSLAALVFNFKSLFIAALVDGKPISRFYLDRLLEKQGGKQVLENEIVKILILNEAKKQKLTITNEEIEAKVKEIEDQVSSGGSSLDSLLEAQGQTRDSLMEQIRIQLIIEKTLAKDIAISDEEVKKYFEDNKAFYDKDKKLEDLRDQITQDLKTQKISEEFQPWLEELKQKAKIYYFLEL